MERALSVEEKIRRAEEIYNRRYENNNGYLFDTKKGKNISFKRRMFKQIIICLIIYAIFYCISNKEYLLSDEFDNKKQEFISQNSYLEKPYNYLNSKLNEIKTGFYNFFNDENKSENESEENNNQDKTNEGIEQSIINIENTIDEQKVAENNENIGGAEDDIKTNNDENDIDYIKNNFSFIVPVNGKISSVFGWRNPTTAKVPKYHTGLDLSAPIGTEILSSTDGEVILASNNGDYGKHYKIKTQDLIIIYAHCSKLLLNEGDKVFQGQKIAEVGSTGNSTGPHLHFEIRRGDRLINPELILNF